MASISSSNTSLPPSWLSESNTFSLRDASFSSYLNSTEETYVHRLVQSSQNLNCHTLSEHDQAKKKAEDTEIDVFSADKYFKGGIEENNKRSSNLGARKNHHQPNHHHQNHQGRDHIEQVGSGHSRVKFQPRTPSNQSESSWNSQSAFLKRLQRNPSSSHKSGKAQGKRFLSCYCCDKKSVEIQDEFDDSHANGVVTNFTGHDNGHRAIPRSIKTSFEVAEVMRVNKLQLDQEPFVSHTTVQEEEEEKEAEKRKSLEVYGSSEIDDGSKRFSLERSLNMLSWDAIPRTTTEEINTSGPPSETCKDTESDASSDLFEIECLSYPANPVLVGPRHPSDGCATPTTCYAPSEASIEWSVVTASAADLSTVSDSEDQRSTLTSVTRAKMAPKRVPSGKMSVNKAVGKPHSGMLLGCKSQKAVRVAGEIYRTPGRGKEETQKRNKYSDSFTPMTRFQSEAKLAGFGPRQRHDPVLAQRSPKRSHSSHASELLYI